MDLEFRIHRKDIEEIVDVAFRFYYNPSIWSAELNTMSLNLINLIETKAPNTILERGILTAFSFFIDQTFLISTNEDFQDGHEAGVPANWRDNIAIFEGMALNTAHYFIKRRNQKYHITFLYYATTERVAVNVTHVTVKHRTLGLELREIELLGLTDPLHCISYALHFVNLCCKVWSPLAMNADKDKPPTAVKTPV